MTFEVICKQGNGESSALGQQVKYVFFFMLVRLVLFANIKLGIRIIDIKFQNLINMQNKTTTKKLNALSNPTISLGPVTVHGCLLNIHIELIDIWMNAAMDVTNETQTVRPNRIRKDVYIITLMDVMYNSCPSKRSQSAIC